MNIKKGLMGVLAVAAMLAVAIAMSGCASDGDHFRETTTHTISYTDLDGIVHTETITTSRFDPEALNSAIDAADRITEIAERFNEEQPKTPEEIERDRQRFELELQAYEALLDRLRNSTASPPLIPQSGDDSGADISNDPGPDGA